MSDIRSLALLPPLHLALSAVFFGVILHTNERRRSWFLPPFLIFSIWSLITSKFFWFSSPLISLWSQAVTLYILHAISLLYIEKWPAPTPLSSHSASGSAKFLGSKSWSWKLYTTYKLWGNPQLIGVTRQNEIQVQAEIKHGAPRLSTYIFHRALKPSIYYCIHVHLMPVIFSKTLVNIAPEDVGPEQQILLRRLPALTSREVILRAHTAVFWIWESIAYLDGANAALAIFFVLIGIDEPADWPPLFGNLAAATSLRKFWSDFWHRLATRPYRNYGREVARPLLGQKPQSILFKTVVAFVVFSLSGMTHAVVMWHAGVADWYLEITWFLLNFVGCLGETMYLSALRALAKHLGVSHELRKIEQSWFGYLTGYAWVFAFFFWSVPKWKYPRLERQAITVEKMQDFLANLGVSR